MSASTSEHAVTGSGSKESVAGITIQQPSPKKDEFSASAGLMVLWKGILDASTAAPDSSVQTKHRDSEDDHSETSTASARDPSGKSSHEDKGWQTWSASSGSEPEDDTAGREELQPAATSATSAEAARYGADSDRANWTIGPDDSIVAAMLTLPAANVPTPEGAVRAGARRALHDEDAEAQWLDEAEGEDVLEEEAYPMEYMEYYAPAAHATSRGTRSASNGGARVGRKRKLESGGGGGYAGAGEEELAAASAALGMSSAGGMKAADGGGRGGAAKRRRVSATAAAISDSASAEGSDEASGGAGGAGGAGGRGSGLDEGSRRHSRPEPWSTEVSPSLIITHLFLLFAHLMLPLCYVASCCVVWCAGRRGTDPPRRDARGRPLEPGRCGHGRPRPQAVPRAVHPPAGPQHQQGPVGRAGGSSDCAGLDGDGDPLGGYG